MVASKHQRPKKKLEHPLHLNWQTRVVIGLLANGYGPCNLREMCLMLRVDASRPGGPRDLRDFIGFLLDHEDAVIRDCVENGLPAFASAELPQGGVRCPQCGAVSRRVSCPHCAPGHWESPEPAQDPSDEAPLATPSEPTSAVPGTWEKVEVMRQRVDRGELPCHPEDAALAPSVVFETVSLKDLLTICQ